jgi:hypothetical protein
MKALALIISLAVALMALPALAAEGGVPVQEGMFPVTNYGAVGDGVFDCTEAFQDAVNAASVNGGIVWVPGGHWLISGSIMVKPGVAICGVNQAPMAIDALVGSVIFATGGRDTEEGPALFELGHSATVKGISVFYPAQSPTDIRPYPWTFHLQGYDNTVEYVTLYNSYQGIKVGPEPNVRHRIFHVYGCALKTGIFVDAVTDIGRIDNVQFHCHWWSSPQIGGNWEPVFKYMTDNCEAFVFGRTDWQYVTNTFVFPAKVGYKFIETEKGVCNGNFTGIGADATQRGILVENCAPFGVLVTNGEFVAFGGDDPVAIEVEKTNGGNLTLTNCAVWGPARQVARLAGGRTSMNNCNFMHWSAGEELLPAIDVSGGNFTMSGCQLFAAGKPDAPYVRLNKGARAAVIFGNTTDRPLDVINESGIEAQIGLNATEAKPQ